MLSKEITVNLGSRSYPIYVGQEMLSSLAPTLQRHSLSGKVVIVTDRNVSELHLSPIEKHLRHFGYETHSIVIPPGEKQKSLGRAAKLFTEMLQLGIDRKSVVLALGGGVIGDLAGFVAATYQRGIPLVQLPTTLLAQVDSSVGGKVAVNLPLGKNMVGAFYQPSFVWVDAETLPTLPSREIVCGLGEVVKYGIALDSDLFAYLESNLDDILELHAEHVLHVQLRCLEIKSSIVAEDERESGLRTILNLGHTIGHAIEAVGHYRLFKHGEAVLLGILAESYMAKESGLITEDVLGRIVGLIRRIPLMSSIGSVKAREIQAATKRDKKSTNKLTRFVLPSRIGEAKIVDHVDPRLVADSLQYLRKLNNSDAHPRRSRK